MKHFVLKTFIFVLIAIGIFHVKSFYLLQKDRYTKKVLGSEVYLSIDKSKKKNPAKKVLLGDSVGKQLFDNTENNDTINSLACNQAIGLAGQYILLHNYIAAGNQIDTAYVFFTPFTFKNNLDQIFTYNYFVKPFYRDEYEALITPTVKKQIEKIPLTGIASYPAVLTSNWSPDFKSPKTFPYTMISPVSAEYLHKMEDLSNEHHFKLVLVAAPTNFKKKAEVDALDRQEIIDNNLQEVFKGFFESIIYLDESYFVDGTHLKRPQDFKDRYKNIVR
jgi:hypothetical protein